MLIHEMNVFLRSMPTPPAQQSTRGLSVLRRAQAIYAHIHRQSGRYTSYPAKRGAALKILERVIATQLYLPADVESQFRRTRIAKAVYSCLRSDITFLYGRKRRNKISLQGKHLANRLHDMIERIWKPWLTRERIEEIRSQKWLKEVTSILN
jgi:hypothetical protein